MYTRACRTLQPKRGDKEFSGVCNRATASCQNVSNGKVIARDYLVGLAVSGMRLNSSFRVTLAAKIDGRGL